jgi:hypothetical protein
MRIRGARAGSVPLPLARILDGIARGAAELDLRLEWLQTDGDPVALIRLPSPQDKDDRQIIIETIELGEGKVYLAGKTVHQPAQQSAAGHGRIVK